MERKILFGIMLISVVALFIGGGTYAYFSDTEIAEDNTFTAGSLNLKVGDADPCTESISFLNLAPGDSGSTSWLIQNVGSVDGNFSISISAITSNENTRYEMEIDAGDLSDGEGELEDHLKVAIWMDKDTSGTWNIGDYYLEDDGSTEVYASDPLPAVAYNIMDDYASVSWTDVQTDLVNGDIGALNIQYDLPDSADINEVQSDSCVFNMTFTLEQSSV